MSQHDFIIANQNASGARADINSGLQSLASNNSGASAPSTTYANMFWYDTANNLLKIRNEGNSAWIDQSNNLYKILDNTIVSNTSGTQTGLIGDQTTSTWNTGTGTTESLISPVKLSSAIVNLSLGGNQVWQSLTGSRAFNTSYENSTGKPIEVSIYANASAISTGQAPATGTLRFQVSTDNSTWIDASHAILERTGSGSSYARVYVGSVVVPDDNHYRLYTTAGTTNLYSWSELR
jgi:hypothetical protein